MKFDAADFLENFRKGISREIIDISGGFTEITTDNRPIFYEMETGNIFI